MPLGRTTAVVSVDISMQNVLDAVTGFQINVQNNSISVFRNGLLLISLNDPTATPIQWSSISVSWFRRWEERRSGFCCSTTTSSRGGKKMWCVADLNDDYIDKMEDVLETYEQPYDPAQPVVCMDEKPVTLHADVRLPSPAKPGREARQDSEYERCGTANVFCAVEPKAGRHFTFPTPDRSGFQFAQVLFHLALQ